jgi:hypothetical protein
MSDDLLNPKPQNSSDIFSCLHLSMDLLMQTSSGAVVTEHAPVVDKDTGWPLPETAPEELELKAEQYDELKKMLSVPDDGFNKRNKLEHCQKAGFACCLEYRMQY